MRILIILSLLIGGCSTTSKVTTADKTREDLRDVFILTIFAQDYLRNTDSLDFNLEKLIEYDSLSRISKNFEKVELIYRGGHIAIQYKYSKMRNFKIEFTEKEKQMKEYLLLLADVKSAMIYRHLKR